MFSWGYNILPVPCSFCCCVMSEEDVSLFAAHSNRLRVDRHADVPPQMWLLF